MMIVMMIVMVIVGDDDDSGGDNKHMYRRTMKRRSPGERVFNTTKMPNWSIVNLGCCRREARSLIPTYQATTTTGCHGRRSPCCVEYHRHGPIPTTTTTTMTYLGKLQLFLIVYLWVTQRRYG